MPRPKDVRSLFVVTLLLSLVWSACGQTVQRTIDDASITARVKTALLNDPQVGATKIDVATSQGVVTITGEVKSKAEEERAVQLARQVNGVKEVVSKLKAES
jgi:hyperosmotically inducible protein